MKKNKINAYLLRVDEMSGAVYHGYLAEVENDLKAEQLYVNYNQPHALIEVIRLTDQIVAIMNEEGKIKNFYVNRILLGENEKVLDFISGNIMCVRCDVDGDGEFTSILPSDIPIIEKILVPVVKSKYMKEWH